MVSASRPITPCVPLPRITCPISFAPCAIYTRVTLMMKLALLSLAICMMAVSVSGTFMTPSDCPIQNCLKTTFQPQVDYFPIKLTTQQNPNFAVDYYNNFKVLSNKYTKEQFVITLCGTPVPLNNSMVAVTSASGVQSTVNLTLAPSAKFFQGPITKVAIDETVTANILELLGARSVVAAMDVTYITSPCLHAMYDMKIIQSFPSSYGNLTIRNQIISQMDMILDGNTAQAAPKFLQASVTAELSPQRRLEWVKYLGALLNREFAAQALYDSILLRYNNLKQQAQLVANQTGNTPVVAWLNFLQGYGSTPDTWYIKNAQYQQVYTRDAGGIPYAPVNNTFTNVNDLLTTLLAGNVSIVIDETYSGYYTNGLYQDFLTLWGLNMTTLTARNAVPPFLVNKQVWRDDRMHTPTGGDDWFERAIIQIDAVLQDLITIIQPTAVTAKTRVWFRHFSIDEPYGQTLDRCTDISAPLFPLLQEPLLKNPSCPTIPIETTTEYQPTTAPSGAPTGAPTGTPNPNTTSAPTTPSKNPTSDATRTTISVGVLAMVMAMLF